MLDAAVNDTAPLDLRSDTVTRPSPGMRRVMADAEVGDAVLGDDYTTQALEAEVAGMAGKEAGLFFPSGTQSNLAGLMAHCGRGDEYIVGQQAHTYKYEGGGAAVLGSIQPQPIENADDGSLPLDKVQAAIKPMNIHFARTKLLALENTITGRVLPAGYTDAAAALARQAGLAVHLDGARAWNAAVASGSSLEAICGPFDSVSLCMSKGMGAPVGSVLVGPKPLLEAALRWRKVLGGGMRQSGVLAAAALYAARHNFSRMAEDHANAAHLADGLAGVLGPDAIQYTGTNMVLIKPVPGVAFDALGRFLKERNMLVTAGATIRLVTHLDASRFQIDRLIQAVRDFVAAKA